MMLLEQFEAVSADSSVLVRARKQSLFGKRVTIKNFVRASFDFGGPNALRQRISQLDFVVRSWPD
jgi:hypothetical protein